MRTELRRPARQCRGSRPALRGPSPRRRARAACVPGAATRHGANWWRSAARPVRPVAPARALRPAAGRNARPCRRAAPWDSTSAAVPLSASTWRKPKAAALRRIEPTLPASCSRSSTTVGCVRLQRPAPAAARSTKPMRAGDSESAHAGKQRVGDHNVARRHGRPFGRGQGPEGLGKHRDCGLHAALAARPGTGDRPPARCGPACDRRVPSCASRRRSLSSALSREVTNWGRVWRSRYRARRPRRRPHPSTVNVAATGLKNCRWWTQAPCIRSASRCSGVP